ncbi:hypothetical protein KBTX_02623 [wastewater metagenome]|uniref:Methyl-accepting chemotaxis protein n=2 Tax=unclassified sequences TaxID=12908 RepID=A0A5B8RCC2_9ZZZZ|nr:hypothetical protein KBTEX_02623 [uncultured organism]
MTRFLKKLAHPGVTTKMLVVPISILAVFVVVGAISVRHLGDVDERIQKVATDLAPRTAIASELLDDLSSVRLSLQAYLNTHSQAALQALHQSEETLKDKLQTARESFQDPERAALVERFVKTRAEHERIFNDRVAAALQKTDRIADEVLDRHGPRIEDALLKLSEQAFNNNHYSVSYFAESANRHLLGMQVAARRYLRSPDEKYAEQVERGASDTRNSLDRLKWMVSSDEQREAIEQSLTSLKAYLEGFRALDASTQQALKARREALEPAEDRMADLSTALQQSVFDTLGTIADDAHRQAASGQRVTVVLLGVAVIVGLAAAWLLIRSLVRPMLRAEGQLTALLGDLEAGHADLGTRLSAGPGDEVGRFIDGINRFLETLQTVVNGIATEANRLASSADEITAVSGNSRDSLRRQRSEIEQVVAAIGQLATTSQTIARNTAEAASSARTANDSVDEGHQVVDETVNSINSLANEVEEGAQAAGTLREQSERIGTVLDVIRDVAEQTNLLALNAAIEAARAGEQGRGFAVVAEEVRTLARRTQESTGQIQGIIEELQRGAGHASDIMERSRESASHTVERAARAGAALSEITSSVNRITEMSNEIAGAAEEQTATFDMVSQSVDRVSGSVEDSVTEIDRLTRSSEELAEMGERLRGLLARFRGTARS